VLGGLLAALTGLDVQTYVPGLTALGIHLGFNVVLGLLIAAAAIVLQRARQPVAA
jgi:hypothetical protein